MSTSTLPAITTNDRLTIVKGCKARGMDKGVTVQVTKIEPMGADYSHFVKVVMVPVNGFKAGTAIVFYARHVNRLADAVIRMNDGNPSHVIEVRRR